MVNLHNKIDMGMMERMVIAIIIMRTMLTINNRYDGLNSGQLPVLSA